MSRQLTQLSERDKRVKYGWNRYRKLLEEKQHFFLFEKICKTALGQIQELMKESRKDIVKSEIGPIKEKLAKIYEAAENYQRNKNLHADQMKLWIEKIKVNFKEMGAWIHEQPQHKHIALYKHAGEDLSELGTSMPKVFPNSNGLIENCGESEKDKRRSNLLAELIRKEFDYIEILKSTLEVYRPAALSAAAPAALRSVSRKYFYTKATSDNVPKKGKSLEIWANCSSSTKSFTLN